MKKSIILSASLASVLILGACAQQNSPSMMNANKIQLAPTTEMKQVPVAKVKDGYLRMLAEDYARYGSGTMNLSLGYDPASKSYTAMKAFNDLAGFKTKLGQMGVRNVTAETVKVTGEPTLMVSYDAITAHAPEGCTTLPGLDTNQTTRNIGSYKFGCSLDTMVARQIYRPADLQGNDQLDPGDGRRAANSTEHYRVVTEEEATSELEVLERAQIQAQ